MLPPWHENLSKRQVESPKAWVADSGLLHSLLDVETFSALERHPKLGASFEGHCIEQLIGHLKARPEQCYFWATQAGAELDLLVIRASERRGFEISPSHFEISPPDLARMQRFVGTEIAKLIELAYRDAGEGMDP